HDRTAFVRRPENLFGRVGGSTLSECRRNDAASLNGAVKNFRSIKSTKRLPRSKRRVSLRTSSLTSGRNRRACELFLSSSPRFTSACISSLEPSVSHTPDCLLPLAMLRKSRSHSLTFKKRKHRCSLFYAVMDIFVQR